MELTNGKQITYERINVKKRALMAHNSKVLTCSVVSLMAEFEGGFLDRRLKLGWLTFYS